MRPPHEIGARDAPRAPDTRPQALELELGLDARSLRSPTSQGRLLRRGRGIGRRLLELGEEYLRAQGIQRYFCYVNKGNAVGQRFYDRQGFRHAPKRDLEDSHCMEKVLARLP